MSGKRRAAVSASLLILVADGCARQTGIPPAAEADISDPGLSAEIAALAEPLCADAVAVGVYRNGDLIHRESWRRDGGKLPADAQFELGSLAKHPTAIAVLKLQEEGALSIEDRLGAYVDGLPESWRSVTLHQLLNHTSGAPDYEAALGYDFYETDGGREEILGAMADAPLDFEPGSSFAYSNTGYYLLSLVIETVSGKVYADYMQANVFSPAGMTHTVIGARGLSGLVQGYKSVDGAPASVTGISAKSSLGAGALVSTIEDWGRWLEALEAGAIVSAASLNATFTPSTLTTGEKVNYGFGMIVDSFRGEPRRMHTGQTSGFTARFETYPGSGVSSLVLANCHDARLGAISAKLALAFAPGLDYSKLSVPEDPDPASTARARHALEQAFLETGETGLLAEGMQEVAGAEGYAELRTALAPSVRSISAFAYLKTEEGSARNDGRFVYRTQSDEGVLYWILTFRDGLLTGLDWADA